MTTVYLTPHMSIESAIALFKKKVAQDGVLKELRKREYYVKPSIAKKQKQLESRKLNKKLANKRRK